MPTTKRIRVITDQILDRHSISYKEAHEIYCDQNIPLFDVLWSANKIRERFKKNTVKLCSIVNAKSGSCSEDCTFCAQSGHNRADAQRYSLLGAPKIVKAARGARENRAGCFGIVTSGKKVRAEKEIAAICASIKAVKKRFPSLRCSASLGAIDARHISALKRAGLYKLHHNLESSRDYFPYICTTHTYDERLNTVRRAKEAGLKVCSGGIFGVGEKKVDRLAMAFALRDLGVDSVPLNFLHPIPGTRVAHMQPMSADEILRTIAIFRMILPKKDISVCGGRVVNLRSLQCMIFFAGANGMMIGNYLTQAGQDPQVDLKMIRDLGLKVE